MPARPAMAQRAQPPIGIADRDRRQPARRRHDVRGTVANRLTGVNLADLQDFRLEPDDLPHRVGAARLRVDAVERRARTNKIEVVRAAEKNPGRGREARRHTARLGDAPTAKRARWSRFSGWSGSSAQARWLNSARQRITPARRDRRRARRIRAPSGRAAPSRCRYAASPAAARAAPASCRHSAIWPGSFSTGTRQASANSSAEPGTGPFSTAISSFGARACAQRQRLVQGRDKKPPAPGGGQRTRQRPRHRAHSHRP